MATRTINRRESPRARAHKMSILVAPGARPRALGQPAAVPELDPFASQGAEPSPATVTVWRFAEWRNEEAYRSREAPETEMYSTEYNDLADIPGFGGYSFVAEVDVPAESYAHRSAVNNREVERKRWAREPALPISAGDSEDNG